MSRLILGLNTDHGDSSAVLVGEQGIIAGIADERISRKKHSADFPSMAIAEVLRLGGVTIRDVTDIAVARDPRANLWAKLLFIARYRESGLALAKNRLRVHDAVRSTDERIAQALGVDKREVTAQFHQVEHHLAHVASAFFWSPFESCTALTVDGAGDFATSMVAKCDGLDIDIVRRSLWPHSLGVFYSAVTQFLGFDRYGEEYKVMGLSAYGKNRFSGVMHDLVRFEPGLGSLFGLRLNLDYFRHHTLHGAFEEIEDGEIKLPRLWGDKLAERLGPARKRGTELTDRERDLAASMQVRYEEVFLDLVNHVVRLLGKRDLVLAGGCALNSVANGRMIGEGFVDRAYFQAAASDDGTALGAALYVLHSIHRSPRLPEVRSAFWGSSADDASIEAALQKNGRAYRRLDRAELLDTAASAMAQGKIVGWFQGREEWGPRALGNRSILCNPGWPDMKAILNARIKNREPFRPFAPVVQVEDVSTVFEGTHEVPFMIAVYKVRPEWRDKLAAITHEDGTGRVQTVRREDNALYYDLIGKFKEKTGLPALLNTSFNENEPIVHTPAQAIDCFERTRMDALGIGSFWLDK